jgi:hypothetical protein
MTETEKIAEGITLHLGDCRDVLPAIGGVDAVISDPPYPDYHTTVFRAHDFDENIFRKFDSAKQFIFWSPRAGFPLDYTAIHIWHKTGSEFASYERIFERGPIT